MSIALAVSALGGGAARAGGAEVRAHALGRYAYPDLVVTFVLGEGAGASLHAQGFAQERRIVAAPARAARSLLLPGEPGYGAAPEDAVPARPGRVLSRARPASPGALAQAPGLAASGPALRASGRTPSTACARAPSIATAGPSARGPPAPV